MTSLSNINMVTEKQPLQPIVEELEEPELQYGFLKIINQIARHDRLSSLIYGKLQENGLVNYQKWLGRGLEGDVFQVMGTGNHADKMFAVKIFAPSFRYEYSQFCGDGLSMSFPSHSHLVRSIHVLVYDEDNDKVNVLSKSDSKELTEKSFHLPIVANVARFVSGLDLFDRLGKKNPPLSIKEVRDYLYDMAEALSILHNNDVVPGDLAARNIVLANFPKENKSSYRAKLCDFTRARRFEPSSSEYQELFNDEVLENWCRFDFIACYMILHMLKGYGRVYGLTYMHHNLKNSHPQLADFCKKLSEWRLNYIKKGKGAQNIGVNVLNHAFFSSRNKKQPREGISDLNLNYCSIL